MKVKVLYEDNHFIAAFKPSGLLSQGDQTGDPSILDHVKGYLKVKYNKPGNVFLGACHRLDRPVSGIILLGKTSKGLGRMADLFKNGKVTKKYVAISKKMASEVSGTIKQKLYKDRKKNQVVEVRSAFSGKWATTHYEWISSNNGLHMYMLTPITGRSHQLRVAMQSLNCPIMGDLKYGGPSIGDPKMIGLHAFLLSFIHPVSKEQILLRAPLPEHMIFEPFHAVVKDL